MSIVQKICQECGKIFITTTIGNVKYCSKECANRGSAKKKGLTDRKKKKEKHMKFAKLNVIPSKTIRLNSISICLNCGHEYLKDKKDIYTQFCSNECKKEFNQKINENKLPALINLRKISCVNCQEDYWMITNNSVYYCSLKCKYEFEIKTTIGNRRPDSNHHTRTLESREKQSITMMERIRKGLFYANSSNKGYYNFIPHFVRSTWEANFSLILMYLNREYKFEAKYFKLEEANRLMLDFYDVKRNIFYEVKGMYIDDAEDKMNLFKQKYPQIKVHVITREKYVRIYKYFGKKIQLIESFPRYDIDKGLNLMTLDEFNQRHIKQDEHEKIYGDYNVNPYKIWKDEYDKRLGL